MKKLALTLSLLFCILAVSAQKVSNTVARQTAESFWSKSLKNNTQAATLQYCLTDNTDTSLFIYNIGNSGFVAVSGDYSCEPIVAYSTEGNFVTNMDPSCKAWLRSFSGQIAVAKKSKSRNLNSEWNSLLSSNQAINEKKTTKSVLPLLTTKWNQDKYYNHFCPAYSTGPDGHCYTGCVATSMAQIMKYYNYPAHGFGSHSYSHPFFGVISAIFDTTYYDWPSMNTYGNNLTENAISTLMFQCGVSVDMDYSPVESGAQTSAVVDALKNYFHYRSTVEYISKLNLDNLAWIALLKDNLDQNHPVLYSGVDQSLGGHAWVCDGYDVNDKFHMNWGWGGANNGYFQVDTTVLNSGNGDFALDQGVVVNIMPYFAPYCMTGRTFTDSTNVISDGSGYSYYWNNTHCDWLITPTGAEKVLLQFADFNTENGKDFVSVYDGETTSDPLLMTFSGSTIPDTILTANSGKMFITFNSDSTTQGLGWTAKYWSLKHGAGIQEDEYGKVSVYPNPALNDITITNQVSINEPVTVKLFDYSGKEVYSSNQTFGNGNTLKIDVSKLDAGFYIVALQSEHHNYRSKFIKL